MIFTPFKIKEKSEVLFLAIFTSFLILSFSHTHNFNFSLNALATIQTENTNSDKDLFLDSSLNCTIQSFNNSIEFQNIIQPIENIYSFPTLSIFEYQSFHYNSFLLITNQLRAPPIL
ncbi:MAG: hypothetical protein IPH62_14080 [Ignavibacteriae bacterium]|nr:hypothetical protein [Ignavibacteriota bacterium]